MPASAPRFDVHSTIRFGALMVTFSIVLFVLFQELLPSKRLQRWTSHSDEDVLTPADVIVAVPTNEASESSAPVVNEVTSGPNDTIQSPLLQRGLTANGVFITFPNSAAFQETTEVKVVRRGLRTEDIFPCFRPAPSEAPRGAKQARPYDVVIIPVGCFGDVLPVGQPCKVAPCFLAPLLAAATRCGSAKAGMFLGDNFYPWGLRHNDPRFEYELREKFFRYPDLQMNWYATVGNHDKPKPYHQIRADHPYWKMPAFHHASPVIQGAKGTSVQLFLFDTHWGFELNDPHMEEEAKWLDDALKKSTARWKIVGTHEPIWNFLGFEHNRGMMKYIHPVWSKIMSSCWSQHMFIVSTSTVVKGDTTSLYQLDSLTTFTRLPSHERRLDSTTWVAGAPQ